MRNHWEESDIKAGMHVIVESSPENSDNLSFAASVTYMVTYNDCHEEREWGISSVNDGMTLTTGGDKQSVAAHFNEDRHGYRPLNGQRLLDVLAYANNVNR